MALGAIDAYDKLNLTESSRPVFFGIDGTDEGLQAIVDEKMSGTVYNDKEGQAGCNGTVSNGSCVRRGSG